MSWPLRGDTAPTASSCTGDPVPWARAADSTPGSATLIRSGGTVNADARRRAVGVLVTITREATARAAASDA